MKEVENLNAIGVRLHDLGHPDMALLCYRQAIQIRPDRPELFYNLARLLEDLNYQNEAIEQYRHTLHLEPNFPKALNALGTLLHKQQRWTEALDGYDRALAIQPDYAEVHSDHSSAGWLFAAVER